MAILVGLFLLLTITGTLPIVGLLTIFLSTQVLVCFSRSQSTNYPECNKPFQCGTMENLSYPFRQRGSPEYCGEPGFELTCEGDNPMITINSQSYKVLASNTPLRSLTVAPINITNNVLCPQHPANISLNLRPFHSAWNTKNVTLFHDCPTNPNQPIELSNHQFHCTMNGTNIVGYFVVTSAFNNLSAAAKDVLKSCRSIALVPAPVPLHLSLQRSSDGFSLNFRLTIGLGVAGVAILAIAVMLVTFKLKKELLSKGMLMNLQRGKKKQWEMIEAFILQYGSELAPKRYSYSDIKKITKSFKDELGKGGFGKVYKGKLPDGRLVAVKVLSESKGRGEEFINEVASISRTSHVNIVAFLGFCFEGSIRALIYEFMPNGLLDKFICHGKSPDKWHQLELKTTLYEIAVGIARGLEYLHQGCSTRILHFDIKPQNILLDENFCPKISDFGLAKLCERKESILSTISVRGTIGYIAPEVFCRSFGGVSHKSDVYSYGMMILEVVREKGNVHSQTSEMIFPIWIYERLKEGADLNPQGMTPENGDLTRKMIIVSLWCIQSNPLDRPSMTKVLGMLQGSIDSLPIPPKLSLFLSPSSPENSLSTLLFPRSNSLDNSEYDSFSRNELPSV